MNVHPDTYIDVTADDIPVEEILDTFADVLDNGTVNIQFYPQFLRDISSEIRELRAAVEHLETQLASVVKPQRAPRKRTGKTA